MKNFSPLPLGGHGHLQDPSSPLMELVCCRELRSLPGLSLEHPTWLPPLECRLEGNSHLQVQGQRVGRNLSGSLLLLLGLLSGLQCISQENRASAAGMVWGFGMLAEHRLRVIPGAND